MHAERKQSAIPGVRTDKKQSVGGSMNEKQSEIFTKTRQQQPRKTTQMATNSRQSPHLYVQRLFLAGN